MAQTLFFFGTGSSGSTIWQSTPSGFKPIDPGVLVSETPAATHAPPPYLFAAGNKVYAQSASGDLLAWDSSNWSDAVVNWPANGSEVLNPQGFAAFDDVVYFNGTWLDGLSTTQDLFAVNATSSEPTQITSFGLGPSSLAAAFGKLFFAGTGGIDQSGNSYTVLFECEGSGQPQQVAGVFNPLYLTVSLVGSYRGPTSDLPGRQPIWNPPPQLFMSGQDSPEDTTTWLYRYDGSYLHKIAPSSASSSLGLCPYGLSGLVWQTVHRFGELDEDLYHFALFFSGVNASGDVGLWTFGANQIATEIISTASGDDGQSLYPFNLTDYSGKLYFTGYDTYVGESPSRRGLWVYDPVANHASEIINSSDTFALDPGFNTDWEGPEFFNQPTMAAFNDDVYFSAESGGVSDLWRAGLDSEGTSASPHRVTQGGVNPFSLLTVNS